MFIFLKQTFGLLNNSLSFSLIVFFCLALFLVIFSITFNKMIRKLRSSNSQSSKSYLIRFLLSSNKVILIHFYFLCIYYFLDNVCLNFLSISGEKYISLKAGLKNINNIFTSIFIAIYAIKLIEVIPANLHENRHKLYNRDINLLIKIAKYIICIIALFTILGTLGINITGILAFGGIGSIAAGMAAKDLLSNFFGFLILILDKPFKIGEHIFSPDKEIEGEVVKIGARVTKILTNDKKPVYIPNSVFSTIIVQNNTKMLNRRIIETLHIKHHQHDIETIYIALKNSIESHKDVDTTLPMFISISSIDINCFKLDVKVFIKTKLLKQSLDIKQDILLIIYRELIKFNSFLYDGSTIVNTIKYENSYQEQVSNLNIDNIK